MKKLSIFLFLCGIFNFAFAETNSAETDKTDIQDFSCAKKELSQILDEDITNQLITTGCVRVYKYKDKDMSSQIAPKIAVIEKMNKANSEKNFNPIFLMEQLCIFKTPNRNEKKNKESFKPEIDKILKSISKLEGIEYYSNSRKKMRTLYSKSFAVKKIENSKDEYKRIDDPIGQETDGLKILACQEDLTFGKYIYSYEYFKEDNAIGTICTNTENLKYSIFKVISANNLKVRLVVKELKDSVLVYCSTEAKFARLPGLEKKLKNSFSSRLDAMYNWFLNEYMAYCKEVNEEE